MDLNAFTGTGYFAYLQCWSVLHSQFWLPLKYHPKVVESREAFEIERKTLALAGIELMKLTLPSLCVHK